MLPEISDRWCVDTDTACYFLICFFVSFVSIVCRVVGSFVLEMGDQLHSSSDFRVFGDYFFVTGRTMMYFL